MRKVKFENIKIIGDVWFDVKRARTRRVFEAVVFGGILVVALVVILEFVGWI